MVSKALVFGIKSLLSRLRVMQGAAVSCKSVILLAAVDSPLPAAS
jgi:hypothetical protein